MANKKYDKEEGVWRTIGGRRVFIKTGVSLSQAMKDSGKFKRKGYTNEDYQKQENNIAQLRKDYRALETEVGAYDDDEFMSGSPAHDELRWGLRDKEDELREAQNKYREMEKNPYVERKYGVNKQELNNLKHPKGLKTYDSVEDRYNKDKDFRNMLKKIDDDYNDDKLMSRKEYDKIMRESGMYEKHKGENINYEDYIEATKNVGSIKEINQSVRNSIRDYEQVNKEFDESNLKVSGLYAKPELKTKEDFIERHKQLELAKNRVNKQYELDMEDARMTGNDVLEKNAKKVRLEQLQDIERLQKENKEKYLSKTPYDSKAYAKQLSKSYNADSEYEDKITPKYIQDIDAGRYGNMSDEEAIKNWIDGGADIIYNDDAERQLKEWGIPVKNDDAYGTYKSELAKQLLPIYERDKSKTMLSKMGLGDLREIAKDYNLESKGLSRNELIEKLLAIFDKR